MTTPQESAASAPSNWSSLQQRTATGLVMVTIAALILWLGGWVFIIALTLAALQMNREWWAMRPQGGWLWRAGGLAYSALPCASLIILRGLEFQMSAAASLTATLFPLAMVIATDTGAYFAGKTIGGPKLAPRISPKKTWAGLLGGMAASMLVAALLRGYVPWPHSLPAALMLGAGIALLGQAGDLLESWLKRIHHVKDSGTLLPGHGGLMDRMDGYVFVLPVYLGFVLCYAELLP